MTEREQRLKKDWLLARSYSVLISSSSGPKRLSETPELDRITSELSRSDSKPRYEISEGSSIFPKIECSRKELREALQTSETRTK